MSTLIRIWALLIAIASLGCGSGDITPDGGEEDGTAVDADAGNGSDEGGGADEGGGGDDGGGGTDTGPPSPYQICIDKINALRATKNLPAYSRWASAESCVDDQATSDEQSNSPHGSFGQCGENAQNECLGGGAARIESCLDSMWAEKDLPGCSGCDACADAYNPNCPDCDFYGDQTGKACGHYVNMSAKYFSQAACGFSDLGGWAAIDFR